MNISYRYIDPDMIFTNNREEVISRIQTGEWDCGLCPQMFGYESGCYGLFVPDKPKREQERKPKRGFQVLSSLAGKRSITNLSSLMAFRINCRSLFIPVKSEDIAVPML